MCQVKAMKGVGGSSERLHSSSSGPNQWEVVAMDYVDLNDLVPQVFCHKSFVLPTCDIHSKIWFGFLLGSNFVQVDDARLEGDHERVEVTSTLPFEINLQN